MIDQINKIDIKVYVFVLVILVINFAAFTHNPEIGEMAKQLITAFAAYLVGQVQAQKSGGSA